MEASHSAPGSSVLLELDDRIYEVLPVLRHTLVDLCELRVLRSNVLAVPGRFALLQESEEDLDCRSLQTDSVLFPSYRI